MTLVAVLVINYHQPIDVAWRFTLREFFMVADFKKEASKKQGVGWDAERLGDFQNHLRNLGAI